MENFVINNSIKNISKINIKATNKHKDNHKIGILFMLFSTIFFASISLIIKFLPGIPLMEIVFFRCLPSMLIIPLILIKNKINILGDNKLLLIIRGLLGSFGAITIYYSYVKIPITDAVSIQRLGPIFIIIFSIFFLHEKYNFKLFPLIILSFIGALLIMKPGFRVDILPVFSALISAIFMAAGHIILRYLRSTDNHWVIINYFGYINGIIAIIVLLLQKSFIVPNNTQLIFLVFLGLAVIGSQFCITLAYRFAPASLVSPYIYFQIIFAGIFEIIFLGNIPDFFTLIGSSIIIFSGILNYRLSKG